MRVLGASHSYPASRGARIALRDQEFPDWVVTFVFGPTGDTAAIVVQPFDPSVPRDRWSTAAVHGISEPASPITVRLLRRLPIGQMERFAKSWFRDLASGTNWGGDGPQPHLAQSKPWSEVFEVSLRPGRQGRPDGFYANLARQYIERLGSGREVADLADSLGFSPSRIRDGLYEARRRDLLTAAPPGKAGGALTEKARELLARED
jgi:hypothetical protein